MFRFNRTIIRPIQDTVLVHSASACTMGFHTLYSFIDIIDNLADVFNP